MKKLLLSSLIILGCMFNVSADEKVYVNSEDVVMNQDAFRIHTGHNVWIEANTMHNDSSGMYVFESSINRVVKSKGIECKYEKMWKCPYCYHFWPVGTPCQNAVCPSKYK